MSKTKKMNEKEKIKVIVGILLEYESTLSDGYEYYSGALDGRFESQISNEMVIKRIEKHLSKIAKEILLRVRK